MSDLSNHQQRIGALSGFGRQLSDTPRGRAVAQCLYLRGLRSWVTPGAYAWFRLCDDIRSAQKAAAALRAGAPTQHSPSPSCQPQGASQ